MEHWATRLKDVGHEKLRVALALLPLGFFGTLYLLVAINAPPGWGPAFGALAVCYLTAFLALASEWFWARWFASGLGWSGLMVGLAGLVTIGWHPTLAIYGGLHGMVVVMLLGPKIAVRYDLQPAWRERFALDDMGVARLRKAVTRSAASLPSLIVWALGPKQGAGAILTSLLVVALAGGGLAGLLRMRTWGLFALGASGLTLALTGPACSPEALDGLGGLFPVLAGATSGLLILAVLPLAGPAVRYFVSLRR